MHHITSTAPVPPQWRRAEMGPRRGVVRVVLWIERLPQWRRAEMGPRRL